MKVVMISELAAVVVLEKAREIPGNADGEDERQRHPERSVKIRVDAEMCLQICRWGALWNDRRRDSVNDFHGVNVEELLIELNLEQGNLCRRGWCRF